MILKLKKIRSSCKYIRVHCGLSSSVVCIASVSVRFRSKERVWKTAWKMAPSFILWLSYQISCAAKTRKSHSSVFLCCETKWKLLLRRLVVLWCIIDRKTSLHNRCYFFAFFRQAKIHSTKWARSARHTQYNGVSTGNNFSVPSPLWVSHAASPPCACFCLPEKREKNNSCYAGCRKTGKF